MAAVWIRPIGLSKKGLRGTKGCEHWPYFKMGITQFHSSLETQRQIVGARESLNGQKNIAQGKVKNGEKSLWGQRLTRPVPNGCCRSAFWLGGKTQKFSGSPRMSFINIALALYLKLTSMLFVRSSWKSFPASRSLFSLIFGVQEGKSPYKTLTV